MRQDDFRAGLIERLIDLATWIYQETGDRGLLEVTLSQRVWLNSGLLGEVYTSAGAVRVGPHLDVLCRWCQRPVEEGRRCHAIPTCHACLPPPAPFEISYIKNQTHTDTGEDQ